MGHMLDELANSHRQELARRVAERDEAIKARDAALATLRSIINIPKTHSTMWGGEAADIMMSTAREALEPKP